MRVLWTQDYNIFAFPGGAERNDCRIVHEGIRRGHDITMDFESSWDLAILSNCVTIEPEIIDEICSHKHIFFMHDYLFCRYRLFFPCLEKCKLCKFAQIWKKRFLSSELIIYLSPLHKEYHEKAMPELKDIPSILVPSTVDPKRFNSHRERIPNSAVSINSLLPFKGAKRTLEYIKNHSQITVQIISPNPENHPLPDNAVIISQHLSYEAIINSLETAEYYIELPETPQPYNRTFAEAKLAGCKVITNELCGAASYYWFSDRAQVIQQLNNAPRVFWEGVEAYGK